MVVAPGGHHIQLVRREGKTHLETTPSPLKDGARPSVDLLLSTATELYGHRMLAVILTGMGRDGLEGCKALRAAGGRVLVQDQATSIVWGMPGVVERAGLANECLPLRDIAPAVLRYVTTAPRRIATC